MKKTVLEELAFARSGDKNDVCNVGVMARRPEHYELLVRELTPERVKSHFGPLIQGPVVRYEWPAIEALNFVCYAALDGGASRSLRMDALGKNFASHLLSLEL
jgi:hypothetical protein